MNLRAFITGLVLLAIPALAQTSGPPPARLALLSRGVNLSHWIWLPQAKDAAARSEFITSADLKALRDAGITHIRLPFEPGSVWDVEEHQFKLDGLSELRGCIGLCTGAGLAVIADAHPTDANSPWAALDEHGACVELEAFWSALAGNLGQTDPERVFIEVLNEPHDLKDAKLWPAAQERLVGIIRSAAPNHTIIVTGDDWGNIDGLKRLKPLAYPNLVYSFHFYEPHNFTHQGATWGWPPWKYIKGVPYPSSPELADPIAARIESSDANAEQKLAASAVRQYGKDHWDAAKIRSKVDEAAAWARANTVAVYCGEFGAYAAHSPRESRVAWLGDTRTALSECKIGWCMWDYTGGFALAPGKPGERRLDADVSLALGLKAPE